MAPIPTLQAIRYFFRVSFKNLPLASQTNRNRSTLVYFGGDVNGALMQVNYFLRNGQPNTIAGYSLHILPPVERVKRVGGIGLGNTAPVVGYRHGDLGLPGLELYDNRIAGIFAGIVQHV